MKRYLFEKYSIIFFIFITGSLIGFIHENLLAYIQGSCHLKQGLIYEPLIPVYGLGILIFYFLYREVSFTNNKLQNLFKMFIIGFFVGGAFEYLCSLTQEKIFETISWNYTWLKYNLYGRTSLMHSLFWGLSGVGFCLILLPFYEKSKIILKKKPYKIAIVLMSVLTFLDCSISFIACHRQTDRRNGVEARNGIEEFLDRHYTDEYLNTIYTNARVPERN